MNKLFAAKPRMSLDDFEEYLVDRPDDEKWELIDGYVIKSMVGARVEHHLIIDNVSGALRDHFRATGRQCRAFRETFFLRDAKSDLSALPDVMVRCGAIEPFSTSISDPVALIEVVSPGSDSRDRLVKRAAYQKLASLQHDVIIERDRIFIDVYNRTPEGFVGAPPLDRAESTLRLAALDFAMPIADVYRDVTFPA